MRRARIVALLLLLAFTQRLGGSLWVHHFYHEGKTGADKTGAFEWQTRCDCFDDAFMPIEGAQAFVLPVPSSIYAHTGTPYLPCLVERTLPLSSLRGPPSLS